MSGVGFEVQLMTVGELSRRTGLSIKAIRRYESLGLIYSAGRSESNYRLFDQSALWCARVIERLRSLGLTIKEIQQLAREYEQGEQAVDTTLDALLARSERRTEAQIERLRSLRSRIRAYRRQRIVGLNEELAAGAPPPPSRTS